MARTGNQQPPAAPGAHWQKFTSLALPGGGSGPVFTASLGLGHGVTPGNSFGIWGVDPAGTMRALVRNGDVVLNHAVRSMSVLNAVKGSPGVTRNFNNTGVIVLHINYSAFRKVF